MTDLKLAVRMLFKTPFVTIVAIVSLALGIGANAAIFSLFHQLLLRALPVQEPDRLVNLSAPGPKPGSVSSNVAGGSEIVFSYPMFRDLERVQTVFTGIAAHRSFAANLAFQGQTLSGSGMLVSGSYFPVLGVQPALGRLIGPVDDRAPGESHVAVLSHAYWQTRFASDPNVLNQSMLVNGQAMTIVGVAPRGFDGTTLGAKPQVFVPITMHETMSPGWKGFDNRRSYWAYLFARLKPGISVEQARVALNGQYHAIINDVEAPLQKQMSDQTMARFRSRMLAVEQSPRGQTSVSGEAKTPLTLLLCVTGLVLLIACANIANLMLARGAARASEMAVRLSIGAGRWQLVRQLLCESLLLSLCGGGAGVAVSAWTLHLTQSAFPADAAAAFSDRLDPQVLLFAAAITMATALLFGLFPAIHSTRADLISSLKGQSGQPSGARSAARFRSVLATAQMTLSMVLLIASGLFIRSLFNISRVNLGLQVDNVVTFSVAPSLNGYKVEQTMQLFERLEDDLAALPGVTAVSDSAVALLNGDTWGSNVSVQGFKTGLDTDTVSLRNELGPGYFRTLGIPLIAGREFTRADTAGAPKVAIVNQAFAAKFNLGNDAVGKWMAVGSGKPDIQIVGLVKNAKYSDVKEEIPPQFFQPYRQDPADREMTFYVRTTLDPEQLPGTVRKIVAGLDPNLPVVDLRTMPQQVRENVFLDRFITVLSTAFACLATLLAAVGLYGVLAYTVAQRTREIGLRMALGAPPSRVRTMVLRQVWLMTLCGAAIGLASVVWLGRLAQSLLYGLRGWDPGVLACATLVLAVVASGAGFIPARRASKVDPIRALRYE